MRFLVLLMAAAVASAAVAAPRLDRRDRNDFGRARLTGAVLTADGRVTLAPRAKSGTLETAPIASPAFDTAVVSWNALTPKGSRVKLEVRARVGNRWTRYYGLAVWTSDAAQPRQSFAAASDKDGGVSTDTLELKRQASALQVRVTLEGAGATLTGLASVTSDSDRHYTATATPSDRAAWGTELPVPERSQMIYPNGGEVWCSPTSMTMILEYWGQKLSRPLADSVPEAAKATWDSVYEGAGNWPFNTAYAGSKGLGAYVDRFSSLTEAEAYIRRGQPLAMSIGWGRGELPGAHIASSRGHIVVLRGFTKTGDPIINDPAAKNDALVRTVYGREAFERAWIGHSGGIVYVVEGQ